MVNFDTVNAMLRQRKAELEEILHESRKREQDPLITSNEIDWQIRLKALIYEYDLMLTKLVWLKWDKPW